MIASSLRVDRRSVLSALSALILVLASGNRATAQPAGNPTLVVTDAKCESCDLTVRRMVSLGKSTDAEILMYAQPGIQRVQHDSRGRYLVASTSTVLVYDSSGTYLESWGRRGEGPGEFLSIWTLHLAASDSLIVIERGKPRLTILDQNGKHVHSHFLPLGPFDLARLPEGGYVVSAIAPAPDLVGFPLHRISRNGELLKSFGGDQPVLPNRPSAAQRRIAVDQHGGVWSARPDRYELAYWTARGDGGLALDRQTDWFPDREVEGAVNTAITRPYPWLIDLYCDKSGLLWVLLRTADQNWAPSATGRRDPTSDVHTYDTIVEVLDPEHGRLLASKRLEGSFDAFTNDGLIVGDRSEASGLIVTDIWQATFTRTRREQ